MNDNEFKFSNELAPIITDNIPIKNSFKFSFEILNKLFLDKLGINIVETSASKTEVVKC